MLSHCMIIVNWKLIFLQVIFVLLCTPWFISVIIFSTFDTQCMIFEQASVVNCSQDFFTANPEHWIFSWLLISMLASIVFLLIIRLNYRTMNYQLKEAKRIYRKGSFASLIFLLITSSVYYLIRIATTLEGISEAISILLFIWSFTTVAVVCCLNYLPRVEWTKTTKPWFSSPWWKECLQNNSNFFIYWLALVMYFVETTLKLLAVMLDIAYDVVPLIEHRFAKEYGTVRGVMVIVIGFKLALHSRLACFFWEKLFHGKRDLFSEPGNDLTEEPSEYEVTKRTDSAEEAIELEESEFPVFESSVWKGKMNCSLPKNEFIVLLQPLNLSEPFISLQLRCFGSIIVVPCMRGAEKLCLEAVVLGREYPV